MKKKVKGINVRLLRRIQKQILKEPKQFVMEQWFVETLTPEQREMRFGWQLEKIPVEIPNCGTAACIGGWAISLASGKNPAQASKSRAPFWLNTSVLAARKLNLDDDQADRLFGLEGWPRKFSKDWNDLSYTVRAKRAVKRIDHFIETKGEE